MNDSREMHDVLTRPQASSPMARLGNVVRARLLDLRTMPAGLRLATLIGIALIAGSGALVVLRDILGGGGRFGPEVTLTMSGKDVVLSDIIVIAAFLILLYGWTCVLTGALHSYGFPAPLALLAFTFFNGEYLVEIDWASLSPQATLITAAPILPLALIWGWAVYVQIVHQRAWRQGKTEPPGLMRWTFGVVFALQLLFAAPSIAADVLVSHGPEVIAATLSDQGLVLFLLAIFMFFLSSSDLMEITDSLATGAVTLTRQVLRSRAGGAIPLLTAITAAVSCLLVIKLAHDQLLSPTDLALVIAGWLILAAIVILAFVAIVRLGRIGDLGGKSARTVPLAMLIVVTIVVVGSYSVLAIAIATDSTSTLLGFIHVANPSNFAAVVISGPAPIAVGALLGVPLLIAGRSRRSGSMSVAGVFACAVGVYGLFATLPDIISLAGGPSPDTTLFTLAGGHIVVEYAALLLSDSGIAMVTALLALGALIVLTVRRQLTSPGAAELLKGLLALNVGLLALGALYAYYAVPSLSGAALGVQAVLVVGAFLWDLLTSGQITNHNGRIIPRNERVLLYLGYSLLLTVSVVLSLAARNAAGAAAVGQQDSATYVQLGLQIIGVPLLYTMALQRIARWWRLRQATPAPVATQRMPQAMMAPTVPTGTTPSS